MNTCKNTLEYNDNLYFSLDIRASVLQASAVVDVWTHSARDVLSRLRQQTLTPAQVDTLLHSGQYNVLFGALFSCKTQTYQ